MASYACPICETKVTPVGLAGDRAGTRCLNADGWPVESRRCPGCGTLLERTALDPWRVAQGFPPGGVEGDLRAALRGEPVA
jgi:hypothetical protein